MSEKISTSTLRERRHQRTQHELVDAMLNVIAEVGIDVATIDRVATHAGMSRGTVYAHYPAGRDEILRAAYAKLGNELVDRTHSATAEADDWVCRLTALAHEMFELARVARIGYFYNVSGPTLIQEGAERGIGSSASIVLIREALESAKALGEISQDLPPNTLAILLVGALREAAIAVANGASNPAEAETAFAQLVEGLRTHQTP